MTDMAGHTSLPGEPRLLCTYRGHDTPSQNPDPRDTPVVRQVSWSPSGQQIASIGSHSGGAVHVWDPQTGELLFKYSKQRGHYPYLVNGRKVAVALGGIAWAPTGHQIASSSWNGTVHLFNARSSSMGRRTVLSYSRDNRDGTGAVVWSPDGKLIACVGMSSFFTAVDVWSPLTGATQWTWEGPQGMAGKTALAWSPDGHRLAMSNYSELYIFDASSGRQLDTYRSPEMRPSTRYFNDINDISWSPKAKYIATIGSFIEIWHAIAGDPLIRYARTEEDGYLNAVAWSPTDGRLASSSSHRVHVWDSLNAVQLTSYPHQGVFTLSWSPDGTYLASGGQDCLVHVWRTRS